MSTTHVRRRVLSFLLLVAITPALIMAWIKRMWRNRALERLREERYRSGQALLRYVQMHNQCSEEVAYQRLAAFVKRRVLLDQQSLIDYLAIEERQRLLELAQSFLMHNPDEIDNI